MNWYKIAKSKRKKWEGVNSSFIKSISYNDKLKVLSIRLLNDETYHYKDVPKDMYNDLLDADSKGQFFNRHIKDNFNYTRGG